MKLEIAIAGPRVHDVGYRYFLMSHAMSLRIRRFEAHNMEGDCGEEVLILVDGGEREIEAFRALAETKRLERAEVSNVVVRDYDGDVMKIGEYAQFCTTVQLNKAIPLLLSMNEKMSIVVEKQEQTISEIRVVGQKQDQTISEIQGLAGKQDQTILEIRGLAGKQDQTISEIQGLRGDLAVKNSIEWQARIERDIRVIKSKLQIR